MAWKKPTTITSWSYSRFSLYRTCPARAKYKFIDKVAVLSPPNPAMERGTDIGGRLEKYLRRETPKLPVECTPLKEEYAFLRKQKNNFVEEMWGFTKNWEPCASDDWNNCVLRIKIDVGYYDLNTDVVHAIDNKTGKYRPEEQAHYVEQLELYSIGSLIRHTAAKEAQSRLYYSDHGIQHPPEAPYVLPRRELTKLIKHWNKRVQPMLNDKRFATRPGNHCRWCEFSSAKGGPCKY